MKLLKHEELQALALGCTLLGSGGGGNPAYDLLIAEQNLKEYGDVRIISLDELEDDMLVVPLAFIGAPLIAIEKLPSGNEFSIILEHLQKLGKKIVLMAGEIGGANGLCALAVAVKHGLPVLDADTMGRAFPQLQMSSCNLNGIKASPAYFADSLGNFVIINATNAESLERIGRHVTMSMGSCCNMALYLMDGKQAKTAVVPHTLSQALELGKAVLDNNANHDPVERIIVATDGICLIEGIITSVSQEVKDGFLEGKIIITSQHKRVELFYQNEYLLAKDQNTTLATTPDILALVEQGSGLPITSDALRYGLQVALIAISAPSIWQTEAGLKLVGPQCFGYAEPYKSLEKAYELYNWS